MATAAGSINANPKGLEERVRDLETYVKVAIVVAGIFGASGAWGLHALSSANKQLEALKSGITTVEGARDRALAEIDQKKVYAVRDLSKTEANEIADIQLKAKPLVKEAMSEEMAQQIGNAKKWTAYIYSMAAANPVPNGHDANGWWETHLIEQSSLAQAELK